MPRTANRTAAPPPAGPAGTPACPHEWRVLARWATKAHCVCVRCGRHRLFARS